MTDKELKKLSRMELLEMLISVSQENEKLKEQIAELNAQLEDKKIAIGNAGSIAEACLQINGIFEAAQASAEQYLENVRDQERILEGMQAEAEVKAQKTIDDAQTKAQAIMVEAEAKASAYWESVSQRLSVFYSEHRGLKEMLKVMEDNK